MIKKLLITSLFSISLITGCNSSFNNSNLTEFNSVSAYANNVSVKHTTVGNIQYNNISSKYLNSKERDIVVYLPPSYESNKTKNYPVLYMHDGQNIFDKVTGAFGKEWYVDEKVEYLIKKNVIEEVIIVGVYNGLKDRIFDYTWTKNEEYGGGGGKSYGEFLTKELKPFIDRTYRTKSDRNNTAVAGSSLGGLISVYLASNYSNIFSKIGAMSPSFWWNNGEVNKEISKLNKNFTFWLDCGTNEGDGSTMVSNVNSFGDKLEKKIGNQNVFKYIHQNAGHNEESWAIRVHAPLITFFGKEKNLSKRSELIKRLMIYEEWAKL